MSGFILGVQGKAGWRAFLCNSCNRSKRYVEPPMVRMRSLMPPLILHFRHQFYLLGGQVNKSAYAAHTRTFLTVRYLLWKGIAHANPFPSKCLTFAFKNTSISEAQMNQRVIWMGSTCAQLAISQNWHFQTCDFAVSFSVLCSWLLITQSGSTLWI